MEGDPAEAVRALTAADHRDSSGELNQMQSAAMATELEQENPLIEGLERLPGAPDRAGHLRRDGRPRAPQAAAGAVQPRPRGGAARALRADRRGAQRDDRRGVPGHGAGVDRAILSPAPRREGAERADGRDALRPGCVRRRRGLRRARRRCFASSTSAPASPLNRVFYLSTAPAVLPGDRRQARRRPVSAAVRERRHADRDREAVRVRPRVGARS